MAADCCAVSTECKISSAVFSVSRVSHVNSRYGKLDAWLRMKQKRKLQIKSIKQTNRRWKQFIYLFQRSKKSAIGRHSAPHAKKMKSSSWHTRSMDACDLANVSTKTWVIWDVRKMSWPWQSPFVLGAPPAPLASLIQGSMLISHALNCKITWKHLINVKKVGIMGSGGQFLTWSNDPQEHYGWESVDLVWLCAALIKDQQNPFSLFNVQACM